MITEDELKKYLPKYLSEENYKTLLAELKSFPYNIDGRGCTLLCLTRMSFFKEMA